jgi:hypothetical protein
VTKKSGQSDDGVTWERVRAIFGNAPPVTQVWERQFDGGDEVLRRIAVTPHEEIAPTDLWEYFHDLCYVELQPELFAYLFPVCLMDWHRSLMRNEACAHGDAEFHRSLVHGGIVERMLTPRQRGEVFEFFRDSLLMRLDAERGLQYAGSAKSASGWMGRLNSLALVMPRIESIWTPWWNLDSPGRAVCALQYASGLIYFVGENPLFDPWRPARSGGGPYLWENDGHLHDVPWLPENLAFFRETVTPDYILEKTEEAAERLATEAEGATARRVADDARRNRALVQSRVTELPTLLEGERPNGLDGWSV